MVFLVPVLLALFYLDTFRPTLAAPPLWGLRVLTMQHSALRDFGALGAGVAAWMGSRDGRRGTTDLVAATARPRWMGQVATWAATTALAVAAYLVCIGVLYGITAGQVAWGGPLWWPVAVDAAGVAAFCSLGFCVGWRFPSRFTAPLVALIGFFVLMVAFRLGYHDGGGLDSGYALLMPTSRAPRPADAAVFYAYLPDLSIVQLMFFGGTVVAAMGALGLPGSSGRRSRIIAASLTTVGVLAVGTAVVLAGTARQSSQGVVIPDLHDAASNQPIPYRPVCRGGAIAVCLHPAFKNYESDVTHALDPLLDQVVGLPGAPVRVGQVASYLQFTGSNGNWLAGTSILGGTPPIYHLVIDQVPGMSGMSSATFAAELQVELADAIAGFNPYNGGTTTQEAVASALLQVAGMPLNAPPADLGSIGLTPPQPAPGSRAYNAAERFSELPPNPRRSWLQAHLAALQNGHVNLSQLP